MGKLAGTVALVTGASSGFGWAIARSVAAEGAAVALVARRAERLRALAEQIEGEGGRAVACPADVGSEAEILAAVEQAETSLGPIDLLVNNAGTNSGARSIAETDSGVWRELLEVDLTSAFLFSKGVLPGMISRGRGTVINIASRAASHPSLQAGVAYSTAKRGMEALTAVTNEEGNPYNVRASVVNPGEGNTPILDFRPEPPDEVQRSVMIQPEDLADLVVLIASLPQAVTVESVELRPTRR